MSWIKQHESHFYERHAVSVATATIAVVHVEYSTDAATPRLRIVLNHEGEMCSVTLINPCAECHVPLHQAVEYEVIDYRAVKYKSEANIGVEAVTIHGERVRCLTADAVLFESASI